MSTKFFTNSQENTLLEKFKGVFTYTKVAAFDALVGYFRSSGYFRIREYLKEVKAIRILVGIDVDDLIGVAAQKGLEFRFNADETRDEFFKRLKEDIQHADYSKILLRTMKKITGLSPAGCSQGEVSEASEGNQ